MQITLRAVCAVCKRYHDNQVEMDLDPSAGDYDVRGKTTNALCSRCACAEGKSDKVVTSCIRQEVDNNIAWIGEEPLLSEAQIERLAALKGKMRMIKKCIYCQRIYEIPGTEGQGGITNGSCARCYFLNEVKEFASGKGKTLDDLMMSEDDEDKAIIEIAFNEFKKELSGVAPWEQSWLPPEKFAYEDKIALQLMEMKVKRIVEAEMPREQGKR